MSLLQLNCDMCFRKIYLHYYFWTVVNTVLSSNSPFVKLDS